MENDSKKTSKIDPRGDLCDQIVDFPLPGGKPEAAPEPTFFRASILGCILVALRRPFGQCWALLAPFWPLLAPCWLLLAPFWEAFWTSGSILGAFWTLLVGAIRVLIAPIYFTSNLTKLAAQIWSQTHKGTRPCPDNQTGHFFPTIPFTPSTRSNQQARRNARSRFE